MLGEKGVQLAFLWEPFQLLVSFAGFNLFPRYVMIIPLGEKQISAAEVALSFPRWGWENWGRRGSV